VNPRMALHFLWKFKSKNGLEALKFHAFRKITYELSDTMIRTLEFLPVLRLADEGLLCPTRLSQMQHDDTGPGRRSE